MPEEIDKESFFEKYKVYIITGGGVIVIATCVIIFIRKKRSEI